jgi:nucleobase:cation symporter-1, NCS1 family
VGGDERLHSHLHAGVFTGVGRDDDAVEAPGDYSPYIFRWLVGYSGLLGPIAGTMIADYFLVRGRPLNVNDLYRRGGEYEYTSGINTRGLASLIAGVAAAPLG